MRALRLIPILAIASSLHAQQSIGTVGVQDATVSGDLSITNGRAILIGSSTVIAKDHTAEIALNRGGTVRVCATSGLHLTQSQSAGPQPLMLALDRGAIELQTAALATDIVMTPDLRFALRSAGPLDLRLRVTKNGDTCVENHGATAPTLGITDQFGEASYELRPNQHVLFEHGSLKEVVDNETSPCGCPTAAPGMSIADALLAAPTHTSTPSDEAAAQHPFPSAISEGLAPPAPVPQAAPGVAHAQVVTTLGYTGDGAGSISGNPAAVATAPAVAATQPSAQPSGFGHRLGHFFKHLFGGN
ncbi:nuclease [Granulicella arctica]|uniref:nuclease n=1 Tax=Granulicella arctica TaxID=940613 RepID=UPI0021E04F6B|nr:nuclease [Granulicella arctica]